MAGLSTAFSFVKGSKNLLCFTAAMTDAAGDADDIAAALEDAIFNEFKSTETKYKNRIRSRIANLKVHCSVCQSDVIDSVTVSCTRKY